MEDAPDWFTRALAQRPRDGGVEVGGCAIHTAAWGNPGAPLLVLVHGGGAHTHWWDHVAPYLADAWQVVALDLGGMGDSGRRPAYSLDTFAAEVAAVVAAHGERAVLVGHSLGGAVSLRTAAAYPQRVRGLVMADSPIRPPDFRFSGTGRDNPLRQTKQRYPDRETVLARFRLLPAQPCGNDFLVRYIAAHSIMETPQGWTWKFDDQGLEGVRVGEQARELEALHCPVAVLYGERSAMFPREVLAYVRTLVNGRGPVVAVPEAHHHLFLDQPLAFVAALRVVLAGWDAAAPSRRPADATPAPHG
jgi:pimeloyl-ACP methyl ester carboxylesterase